MAWSTFLPSQRFVSVITCLFGTGMGGHSYDDHVDGGAGFHGGHFVHMRGLPFRATEGDVAKVRTQAEVGVNL